MLRQERAWEDLMMKRDDLVRHVVQDAQLTQAEANRAVNAVLLALGTSFIRLSAQDADPRIMGYPAPSSVPGTFRKPAPSRRGRPNRKERRKSGGHGPGGGSND